MLLSLPDNYVYNRKSIVKVVLEWELSLDEKREDMAYRRCVESRKNEIIPMFTPKNTAHN